MAPLLEKYKDYLPLGGTDEVSNLGEGSTPLVASKYFQQRGNLFFKMEQFNPTGSFKDRFAAVETTLMKQAGIKTFLATSSGNTGSALAAYSAREGLRCLLFVNEYTPENKLNQMLAYGAEVLRVKDFGVSNDLSAPIFERLRSLAEENGTRLVISAYKYSPEGMEGVKTIAYEIVEQLGNAPDRVFIPVGGGGLLSAVWRGFLDLKERGLIKDLPRISPVQPELNDTIVSQLDKHGEKAREVNTTTAISGLAVQVDIDATLALESARASGGKGYLVTDDEIRKVRDVLGSKEGIYVEPAGATSVAGYVQSASRGDIGDNENVVCILTGHGLKDAAAQNEPLQIRTRTIDLEGITARLLERAGKEQG